MGLAVELAPLKRLRMRTYKVFRCQSMVLTTEFVQMFMAQSETLGDRHKSIKFQDLIHHKLKTTGQQQLKFMHWQCGAALTARQNMTKALPKRTKRTKSVPKTRIANLSLDQAVLCCGLN